MAKDSQPEDDKPRSGRRRRRPQTLDLKAREIGAEEKPRAQSSPQAEHRDEAPQSSGAARKENLWSQWRGGDWQSFVPMPVLTGALGVLAGALIVFLLMPRGGGTDADPRVGQLANEVATLTQRIETLAARPVPPPAPDQSGLGERIDRLTAAIGEAEQRLAAVEKRPEPKAPDLSAVDRRAAAIEATLKDLRTNLGDLRRIAEQAPETASQDSIEKLGGRIGGLEERISALAALRATPPAPPPGDASAREVVVLHALAGAVRSGKPFEKELAAARTQLGERAAKLAAFDAYAAKGLPNVETLERQFADLLPRILRGPEANGNFFERLMTSAARLVEVRRVGEPEGTSAEAIAARAETKLARRDLDGAIHEVESLPETQRAAARAWLEAAKLRRDAEAVVQGLAEESVARAREAAKP